jgi:hypothetical protein
MGLQEMDFQAEFDGVMCIDALEHVCLEDWPGTLARFHKALRPGGVLYATVEVAEPGEVSQVYEQGRALGLPVVLGEVIYKMDLTPEQAAALDWQAISSEEPDPGIYHYYPALEQVRAWLDLAGLTIEEEGTGDGYAHFLVRKRG